MKVYVKKGYSACVHKVGYVCQLHDWRLALLALTVTHNIEVL